MPPKPTKARQKSLQKVGRRSKRKNPCVARWKCCTGALGIFAKEKRARKGCDSGGFGDIGGNGSIQWGWKNLKSERLKDIDKMCNLFNRI